MRWNFRLVFRGRFVSFGFVVWVVLVVVIVKAVFVLFVFFLFIEDVLML